MAVRNAGDGSNRLFIVQQSGLIWIYALDTSTLLPTPFLDIVSLVYDAGNDPDFIFGLRDRQRAGEIVSPRIFATGHVVTAPGGHGGRRGSPLRSSCNGRSATS